MYDYDYILEAREAFCADCEICSDCERTPIEEYLECPKCQTLFDFILAEGVKEIRQAFCPRCGSIVFIGGDE